MAAKSEVFASRRLLTMGLSALVTVLFNAILLGLGGPRFFRAGSPPTSEKSPLMLLVWLVVLKLEVGMLFVGLYTLGRAEVDDSGTVATACLI